MNDTQIVTEMGLCHQFNWNEKGKPAYNRGPGLQLYLDAQKDDYLPPNTKDLYGKNISQSFQFFQSASILSKH